MFIRSPKTIKLCGLFRGCNEDLSYETITNEMGQPIDELRASIYNARNYLERDEWIVFLCVRGEGYKRLVDGEKIESLDGFKKRIRRTAVKGTRRANTVQNRAALSNEDRLSLQLKETALMAIQENFS